MVKSGLVSIRDGRRRKTHQHRKFHAALADRPPIVLHVAARRWGRKGYFTAQTLMLLAAGSETPAQLICSGYATSTEAITVDAGSVSSPFAGNIIWPCFSHFPALSQRIWDICSIPKSCAAEVSVLIFQQSLPSTFARATQTQRITEMLIWRVAANPFNMCANLPGPLSGPPRSAFRPPGLQYEKPSSCHGPFAQRAIATRLASMFS